MKANLLKCAGRAEVDAADVEHIWAMFAGGVLIAAGRRTNGPIGAALKLGGLAFVYRGQQGYRRLYRALRLPLDTGPSGVGRRNERVEAAITVNRPRSELYPIWRNLKNVPIFIEQVLRVHEVDDTQSEWVARAPAGMVIKWEAKIINDVENELIAWTTLEGSGVDHVGSVRFEDLGGGRTRIRVVFRYDPPADMLGVAIAKTFGSDPQKLVEQGLRRFKAIMEIGGRKAAPGKALAL